MKALTTATIAERITGDFGLVFTPVTISGLGWASLHRVLWVLRRHLHKSAF